MIPLSMNIYNCFFSVVSSTIVLVIFMNVTICGTRFF